MSNEINKKYLEINEFIKYCEKNKVKADISTLESYEKAGLLIPVYRLIAPAEFVQADIGTVHDSQIVIPNIEQLTNLYNDLSLYHLSMTPNFQQALKDGHPLDVAYSNKNPFLQKPTPDTFKPWDDYKTDVNRDNYTTKEDTADHYYAPWQIFVVHAINHKNTVLINNITNIQTQHLDLDPLKLIEHTELFQTISDVAIKESLIWLDITSHSRQAIIEGEQYKELTTRTTQAKKDLYQKHNHAEWIKFLRKLVELYKLYLEREKIKLADEMKIFLRITIETIIHATQKSLEDISNDYDGESKGSRSVWLIDSITVHPGEVYQIFPDELKQIKERLDYVIADDIEEFNKMLPASEQINLTTKDTLIEDLIKNGQEVILSHFYKIEELWFKHELHWRGSIWAHIRSLATAIESLGCEWFTVNRNLGKVLSMAFPSDYDRLKDSIENRITDAATPTEFKEKLTKILTHRKSNTKGRCGHHLVIAHLTRNYLAHRSSIEPDMYGSIFIEIYRSLIFTLISLFVKRNSLIRDALLN
jgi:hypothetical protein